MYRVQFWNEHCHHRSRSEGLNVVYRSWTHYEPASDSGEIFVECPTCEIVEEFSTMAAADAFERAHLSSQSHVFRFYFGKK